MRCARCDTENPADARFCDGCGAGFARLCPGCQAPARANARFCGQCGTALGAVPPPPQPVPTPPPPPVTPEPARAPTVGERKFVTILFADVRNSTNLVSRLDPEEALARIDPVVQGAVGAVARFGGIVNEVQGDGIMALFGAPLAAEDHPVRACLAAAALLQHLPPGIEMRVGLHSGEVVVRPSGRDASDYSAIGAAVYLAKRLEQAADPGTARLSGETARLTRGYTDLRPLGAVQAKGWDEPVEMFELLAANARPSWEVRSAGSLSPFVGREAELGVLSAALMRATLGRAQAVVVVADAGMGKSRLAHEFLQGASARGVRVLHAAAAAHSDSAPFYIAAELMRSWIGAAPADNQAAIERRLTQAIAVGQAPDTDEAALRSLLDLPLMDPAAWAALDPARRRQRLLDAARRVVLREAGAAPLVLLVEDLHWVDEASRGLLDALVAGAGAARLLLLASTRPEFRPDWATRSYAAELHLEPLDATQSDLLLQSLVGEGPDLAPLRARVRAGAEGTPLFMEEIARALVESGTLEVGQNRLRVDAAQISIPASVHGIVAARLDRLPPGPRGLLLQAAVIGKDVRTDVLRRVASLSGTSFEAALLALQDAEFLYETSPGTGEEYTFKHAVTQSVAYDAILRTERRGLHARVFGALLALSGDRVDEATERLSDHALAGELWEESLRFCTMSAERAQARFAWPEAVGYYDQALAALAHLQHRPDAIEQAIALRVAMRSSVGHTGDFARGANLMEEASELALQSGDEVRAAGFDASSCMFLTSLGDLGRALRVAERGAAVADRAHHVPTAIALGFGLGQAHWFSGNFKQAVEVLTTRLPDLRGPLRLANTGTAGNAAVMSLVCLSKSHALLGEFDLARQYGQEAMALAAETERPYDTSYALIAPGFNDLLRGRHIEAVTTFEEALQRARAASIMPLVPSIVRYLGRALVGAGRLDAALVLLDEAMGMTRQQKLVGLTAWCGAALAHAHIHAGHRAAAATVDEARKLAARHGYRPVEAICMRLEGDLLLAAGAFAEAEVAYRSSAARLTELGMRPELILARRGVAAVLTRAGQGDDAAAFEAETDAMASMLGIDPLTGTTLNCATSPSSC